MESCDAVHLSQQQISRIHLQQDEDVSTVSATCERYCYLPLVVLTLMIFYSILHEANDLTVIFIKC